MFSKHSTWSVCVCARAHSCGIIVPWPGIEPTPYTMKAQSFNHWTAGEFPEAFLYFFQKPSTYFWDFSLSTKDIYHIASKSMSHIVLKETVELASLFGLMPESGILSHRNEKWLVGWVTQRHMRSRVSKKETGGQAATGGTERGWQATFPWWEAPRRLCPDVQLRFRSQKHSLLHWREKEGRAAF